MRQCLENTLDSTEGVSEGLASRLKETEKPGKADADRAATVVKDAHSELGARLEDESARLLLRSCETERAQEALFEIRYRKSESSRQQLECLLNTSDNAGEALESRLQLSQRDMVEAEEAAECHTSHGG